MEITNVRFNKVAKNDNRANVIAYASVEVDKAFTINNLSVFKLSDGSVFASIPKFSLETSSGLKKRLKTIFFYDASFLNKLTQKVIEKMEYLKSIGKWI